MTDNGVLTYAGTARHIDQAVMLSVTAKKFNNLPVCMVTTDNNAEYATTMQQYFDKILIVREQNASTGLFRAMDQSPYDRTLFVYSDSVIMSDVTGVFDLLDLTDFIFPTVRDFMGQRPPQDIYYSRRVIDKNNLPGIWTNAFCFSKSDVTARLIQRAYHIFNNWTEYASVLTRNYAIDDNLLRFNTVVSMALFLEDIPVMSTSFEFTNLSKQPGNMWIRSAAELDWFAYLNNWITDDCHFKIENYVQQGIVHYASEWMSDDILSRIKEVCQTP